MSLDAQNLVVLGAAGNLTSRLLLPGLGKLLAGDPERRVILWGTGREPMEASAWGARVSSALVRGGCSEERAIEIATESRFLSLDVTDPDQLTELILQLPDRDRAVLYFALPPRITEEVCRQLVTVNEREGLGGLRLALEKPFGANLEEARKLNELLARFRSEDQVFRVDHFLGDSQVLNLLALRFANRLLEPVWRSAHVESIYIVANETIALEGRAGYYDGAGALVDMLQSHLLLVLALVTMEEPARLEPRHVHDLMAHVLSVTQLKDGDAVNNSRRARYTAGMSDGRPVPDYVDEEGVDPSRETETLVEVDLEIMNRRWSGVPIRLRSGKALDRDRREVKVTLKPVEFAPHGMGGYPPTNALTINLNPDEISVRIVTNQGGSKFRLGTADLDAALGEKALAPYSEVLAAILDGNHMIAVRGDIAEECWRICEPILEAWSKGEVPIEEYPAGSTGPEGWQ
ncbi:MAG TPA: glucose-6-phosphate dehydrogenase [Actinomycetaceae bacterium]|nr:glucose-6-phosphate dehydrogenase [Actinomycetaceae bacterium]